MKRKKAANNVVTVQASETIENTDNNTENTPSNNKETEENKIEESN